MIFIPKISKGHNSVKNVGGVMIRLLCISSDDGLWFVSVHSFIKIFLTVLKL